MADNYLGDLFAQASKIAQTKVNLQPNKKPQPTRTNLLPVNKGAIEGNTRYLPQNTEKGLKSIKEKGIQRILNEGQTVLKSAQDYNPFALVNKTPEELKKPFSYFQEQLSMVKPSEKSYINMPPRITALWKDQMQKGTFNNPGVSWVSGNTFKIDKDPTAEWNRQLLTELIAKQNTSLGVGLSNLDDKILSTTDWKSFVSLTADIEKYKTLRKSYMDKPNKQQVDMDWIKQYDVLMNNTYAAMGLEIPKALQSGKTSYDTILNTKNTKISAIKSNIDAIKNLLPEDEMTNRKILDTSTKTNQRDMIASRVKKVNSLTEKKTKPTPVYTTRPI